MINNYIREGKIVPVDVTVGLLKKAMEKNGWEVNNYSFDFNERKFVARRYAGQLLYGAWNEILPRVMNLLSFLVR
jgi:hypothetical protein